MKLIKCTIENVQLLATLNKELFEDETNDNIPSIEVLVERLTAALEYDSIAYLFMEDNNIAGYALVKTKSLPYYLSHFFICKEMRRKHLGTIAFQALMDILNTDSLDLDVFCWNQRGQAFWKSLGFQERCIIMRKQRT